MATTLEDAYEQYKVGSKKDPTMSGGLVSATDPKLNPQDGQLGGDKSTMPIMPTTDIDLGTAHGGTGSGYSQYAGSELGQAMSSMYDQQRDANLARMEEEYNRSRSQAEADAAKIPGVYREQGNDLNAQYERQRRNYNTQAAASGINTGAASQAALAQMGNYQKAYGQIGTAQANAETEAQRRLSDLEASYRSQVNAAIADSDFQKAWLLYNK